ncbi:30S ribosomal protein S15 [Candidatus Malacoplasma girerdii]|uniref:Small ribosomal subunit protein uS15 n=1 Tax=Candidatus Malacoplasma girerdii TaxID=1318617 RepID=A0A097ST60_9BACT|nr:30S ribosomal protein S15 [Candidatus Malacoplasma girerdii]
MAISKDFKISLITQYGGKKENTGSIGTQIVILTAEINAITNHVKTHKKDFSSKRGLYIKVQKRRKLLAYLNKNDIELYRKLIQELDLRG